MYCPGKFEGKALILFVCISLLIIVKVKPIKLTTILFLVEQPIVNFLGPLIETCRSSRRLNILYKFYV